MLYAIMRPGQFIDYQQRRLVRIFSGYEVECIEAARAACIGGKRDTVRAMWVALEEVLSDLMHRQFPIWLGADEDSRMRRKLAVFRWDLF
jgi:hypothetical protein